MWFDFIHVQPGSPFGRIHTWCNVIVVINRCVVNTHITSFISVVTERPWYEECALVCNSMYIHRYPHIGDHWPICGTTIPQFTHLRLWEDGETHHNHYIFMISAWHIRRAALPIPPDMLEELTGVAMSWLPRCKATKWEVISLIISKLLFAAKVLPAVRLILLSPDRSAHQCQKLHHHMSFNGRCQSWLHCGTTFLLLGAVSPRSWNLTETESDHL